MTMECDRYMVEQVADIWMIFDRKKQRYVFSLWGETKEEAEELCEIIRTNWND